MINDVIKNTEERMKKCIELFKIQIEKIHIGRVSPNMLDNIKITYHEKKKEISTPLKYLAMITTKNARTLIITPFDNTIIKKIEKSIIKSDLNFNTYSSNNIIYACLPNLTEEYRKNLIKLIHVESEKTKIAIRKTRHSINKHIKILIKNKTINEDKERYLQDKIQILTNTWIKTTNEIVKKQEEKLKKF